MIFFRIKPSSCIKGSINLPSDKSITHRAIILSSLSKGKTTIDNVTLSKDCLSTLRLLKKLKIKIIHSKSRLIIYGQGVQGFTYNPRPIQIGDSGTTLRIMLGVLAGQPFSTTLLAGKSLSMRPMKRVAEPLRMMGARIKTRQKRQGARIEEYPPITIWGENLKAITYRLPVASAQVKSAILLAGLYAKGITKVIEPVKTRDHTEKMLKLFKADLRMGSRIISIKGNSQLKTPNFIKLPGDISAASFFIVAASLIKNSNLVIRSVGLNPTRCGLIKVLKRMGAKIKRIDNTRKKPSGKSQEPVGDLRINSSQLKGTVVKKQEIPSLIDELPILMVAAALAKGKTRIESVQELRFKETDRISSMIKGLTRMGAKIRLSKKNRQEDIIIAGKKQLKGAKLRSFADHRTAMSLIIAGLAAKSDSLIDDVSCISKSFPNFLQILHKLTC